MSNNPTVLPLSKAIELWCDPDLVETNRKTMQEPVPRAVRRFTESSFMHDNPVSRGRWEHALRQAAIARRSATQRAVLDDFCRRIASGEVVLEGLQIAPTLGRTRERFPALWAPHIKFLRYDEVLVRDTKFINVTASRPKRAPALQMLAPLAEPADTAHASDANLHDIDYPPPPRRPRGRISTVPMIEADLRANWPEVQRLAAARIGGKPNWSDMARAVHKRMRKIPPAPGIKKPHLQTIRTHLPVIYARILSDKPVRN